MKKLFLSELQLSKNDLLSLEEKKLLQGGWPGGPPETPFAHCCCNAYAYRYPECMGPIDCPECDS